MKYKVIISDRDFVVIDEIQDKINNVKWEYNRIGGCGAFSFDVQEKFCKEISLGSNFNVQILRRNDTDRSYTLWYQGRIENKIHNVKKQEEKISIRGFGYQSSLSDIYVDRDYTSQEISTIVTSILDNDICPNTDITYEAGDIEATTFTASSLSINTNALNAMETLANLAGTREWGVDKNRKFFFKARSSTIGFRYPFGKDILAWNGDSSTKEIVNRVIVIGDGGFSRTVNDTPSQNKYGRRDRVVQNTAITANADADQLGQVIMEETKDIVRRAKVTLRQEIRIEESIPIGLFEIRPRLFTWGERKWGEFLWSGLITYQINRVQYVINKEGSLNANIQLGQLRPDVAESIGQLEQKFDQLRQVGV